MKQREQVELLDKATNKAIKQVEKERKNKRRNFINEWFRYCLLYTSPSPRDRTRSRMPSSA